jgi:hypothetical protein
MKIAKLIILLTILVMAQLAHSQIELGDAKMTGGGLFTTGYQGAYGDETPSNHGLDFGFDGRFNGSYYSPNFLSFSVNPYWGQSRNDSESQSITGSQGVNASANLFTGSHFPGSVNYHHDADSTGSFGVVGQPGFTTHGSTDGFGVNWSALLPNLPTLSVGYSQGSGHSTIFGTDQQDSSSARLFNLHSNYEIEGFRLSAYFDHNSLHSDFPAFIAETGAATQDSSGQDYGGGIEHALPLHGSFYVNYNHSSATADFLSNRGQNNDISSVSTYADSTETANATFHPSNKLTLNVNQNYTDNLSGYLAQNLGISGAPAQALDLGSGTYSSTLGGGASYSFTNFLSAQAQATYYEQHYFGKSYSGEFLSGTVDYSKKFLKTFTFSGSVIDSSNGQGTNAVGFVGNINAFRRFGGWQASGQLSYAQNVQTILVTYTTSYYSYRGNVNRRLIGNLRWIAAFSGNHSGLSQSAGNSSHAESYSTSLGMRRWSVNGFYSQANGISILGAGGLFTPTPTPGLTNLILFTGSSYGGGASVTPIKRMSFSGTFSRAISDTLASTNSHNSTEVFSGQLQYHLRRISLLAGYTRFTQGISAIGAPVNSTSYFVGASRWFDFF